MRAILLLAAGLASLSSAAAQDVSGGVELATDENRRGLSWSGGRAAASADAQVSVGIVDASARVATTRNASRHAEADAVADLELGATTDAGPFRLRGHVTAHLFAGARERMDYVELGARGSYSLGPLQIGIGAVYAPDQRAIGGDNLYLFASANAGIPRTPLSLSGALGHSSGSMDDSVRAARLRPLGNYTDWRLGVDYNQFPFTIGLDYIGTDFVRRTSASSFADPGNSGDRVVGRVRLAF
ncbi:TorF family putative porin [Sphingomonas sp. Sphisp140]|uniref:TorF family putative porin n=1 Tax=unclassified Sphingomonas TaxID=196159 RepID=UPI0039AF1965